MGIHFTVFTASKNTGRRTQYIHTKTINQPNLFPALQLRAVGFIPFPYGFDFVEFAVKNAVVFMSL